MRSSAAPIGSVPTGLRWLRLLPAVLLLAWTGSLLAEDPPHCFLDRANLAFHEAGHLFLAPFGRTLHLLGGTLFQLAVPLAVMIHFLRRERPFAAATAAWWLGENLLNVAVYMADARELRLELVGGGEHDWNSLFYQFSLLGEDSVRRISGLTRGLGTGVMALAILWLGLLAFWETAGESRLASLTERFPRLRILFPGAASPT
jgi:hypothetical protein